MHVRADGEWAALAMHSHVLSVLSGGGRPAAAAAAAVVVVARRAQSQRARVG